MFGRDHGDISKKAKRAGGREKVRQKKEKVKEEREIDL